MACPGDLGGMLSPAAAGAMQSRAGGDEHAWLPFLAGPRPVLHGHAAKYKYNVPDESCGWTLDRWTARSGEGVSFLLITGLIASGDNIAATVTKMFCSKGTLYLRIRVFHLSRHALGIIRSSDKLYRVS